VGWWKGGEANEGKVKWEERTRKGRKREEEQEREKKEGEGIKEGKEKGAL